MPLLRCSVAGCRSKYCRSLSRDVQRRQASREIHYRKNTSSMLASVLQATQTTSEVVSALTIALLLMRAPSLSSLVNLAIMHARKRSTGRGYASTRTSTPPSFARSSSLIANQTPTSPLSPLRPSPTTRPNRISSPPLRSTSAIRTPCSPSSR